MATAAGAPPGAADYDWGGREESFKQGLVANMQTWSIGAASYDDPSASKIAGEAQKFINAPTNLTISVKPKSGSFKFADAMGGGDPMAVIGTLDIAAVANK